MFEQYLAESKKTYEFEIGVCEAPEGFEDSMETALQKYSVASMSAGKKTPIQERPLDFPQHQNTEVTYYEISVNYPTTPQVLAEYIASCCDVDRSRVIVRTPNDPSIELQDTKEEGPYEVKLDKFELEQADPNAQDHVGNNRVMELLKELETARKERENDPVAGIKAGESQEMTTTEGSNSPLGSK